MRNGDSIYFSLEHTTSCVMPLVIAASTSCSVSLDSFLALPALNNFCFRLRDIIQGIIWSCPL